MSPKVLETERRPGRTQCGPNMYEFLIPIPTPPSDGILAIVLVWYILPPFY